MRVLYVSAALAALLSSPGHATVFSFSDADTSSFTSAFNQVTSFSFSLEISDPLVAGETYANPNVVSLSYEIRGVLDNPTPSGFGAFDLRRTGITGAEFDAQGSSFEFGISTTANLMDGLQASELDSFVLNAREVNTGRYHPFLFSILPDGTGALQNSNNTGGLNPVTLEPVNVDFAEEYIMDLSFDPQSVTLAPAPVPQVPLPASLPLFLAGLGGLALWRRRAA